MWPFGFSDEEQRRITELRTAWQTVSASGLVVDRRIVHLRDDIKFVNDVLGEIDRGDLDIGRLTGAEASCRRVMQSIFEATKDKRFGPEKQPWGGDIEAANGALAAAAAVDKAAQEAEKAGKEAADAAAKAAKEAADAAAKAAGNAIPLPVKIGLGVVLLLALVIAVKL